MKETNKKRNKLKIKDGKGENRGEIIRKGKKKNERK
jgi:hypothetical protein